MADYYTLLTNAGIAYENACKAAGLPIKLSQLSVGDGNGAVYNPAATATALKREVWRGPLNALFQDDKNPSWLLAEVTIPAEVGGWYVREAGLWTDTGILYAIVKYPESFKPVLATSGSGKEFYIRAIFETSNASQVTLLIDDTVVKATRSWVIDYVASELAKLDGKQSVRAATTTNIVLSGPQQVDGIAVVAGDRVLVARQAVAQNNGIYVVANGAWSRAPDADSSLEVTPGLFVSVEVGTENGDSVWQLTTDAPVVLGSTPLVFEMIVGRTGVVAGAYRSVTVDKLGRVIGGSNPTTLAGFGITDAIPNRNPLPGGSIDIHGDYYAFLTSPLESSVAQNCYWNGTAWYRHDISRPAVCITLDDGRFSVRRVGAGQNPIVWQTMSPVWDASNAKFSGLLERPTTLSGYSIGDAFTKAETSAIVDAAIARLIGSAPGAVDTIEELARALNNNPNFATDIINGLATKAAKATTLQGYGISDAYTQSEINQLLSGKAAKAATLAGYGITNGLVDKNPLPGGSIDIHGDAYAFLTSPLESSVGQNCYWNGTAWYRHDNAQPAAAVTVEGGVALVKTAPAGTGPIVWASVEPLWTAKNATVTSSGGTGTLKLPNGWVQQVFDVTESATASDFRYFPVSFPNECFGVFPVVLSATAGGYGGNFGMVVGDVTKDRFLINAGGSFSGEGRFRVLALGR